MSADELREAEPAMPHSSIYRTLAVLTTAGVLVRLAGVDGAARFELAEVVSGEHHHHLVCTSCGAMIPVMLPKQVEIGLHQTELDAQRCTGFVIESHRVELLGRCRACLSVRPIRGVTELSDG